MFEANMGEELLTEVDNGELTFMVNRVSDDEGVETITRLCADTCTLVILSIIIILKDKTLFIKSHLFLGLGRV